MKLKVKIDHKLIYFWSLVLIAISLPFSELFIKISLSILIINWLWEGEFKRKYQILLKRKSIFVFLIIYLLHILSLTITSNLNLGFQDLKIKLPFLILPIIIGTSNSINYDQVKKIIFWFILSVFVATIICSSVLFGFIDYPIRNFREISIFISHIRFSLMINLSIFSLIIVIYQDWKNLELRKKSLVVLMILWLIVFLFLLKSLSGVFIFIVVSFLCIWVYSKRIMNLIYHYGIKILIISTILFLGIYVYSVNERLFNIKSANEFDLLSLTNQGNAYEHNFSYGMLENGNYVMINVCVKELEQEWTERSVIPFNGYDYKGQVLKYTLIRYLASKGFNKDAQGISNLNENDIHNIENGMANYIFENVYSLYPRIYQNLWEIDCFKKGFSYSNSSLILRYFFAKTAINVIRENFWLGVGHGDVKNELQKQYKSDDSILPAWKRRMPHNQYISYFIAFGFIGFLLILFAIIFPIFYEKKNIYSLFIVFFLIVILSFLNEDTAEKFIGISFISFFYSIFIFGYESIRTYNLNE